AEPQPEPVPPHATHEGTICMSRSGSVTDLISVTRPSRTGKAISVTGRSPTTISAPAVPRTVIGRSVAPDPAPARALPALAAAFGAPRATLTPPAGLAGGQ